MKTTLTQLPGRSAIINGNEYLFFSGYSYLGLGLVKEFANLIKTGIDRFGVVYPSSMVSNTPLSLYHRFEEQLAVFTQTEDAAAFSSGFLSARTAVEVVSNVMNVYCTEHTHPASSAQSSVQFLPATTRWESFLIEKEQQQEFRFALVADSINPTPGHINDFSFLLKTPSHFQITLVLDDSHGIGWLGENGRGGASLLSLPSHIELLLNFSLSKAFHINGGAVCGSRYWIEKVKQHVNFTTSTPIMPALAYAWIEAQELFSRQRQTLLENIEYLQKLVSSFTFVKNEGTPVFAVDLPGIAPYLLQNNALISSFAYPHPESNKVNRVVVNALHLKSDLEKLALLLQSYSKKKLK